MSQLDKTNAQAFKQMVLEGTLETFTNALKRFAEKAATGDDFEYKAIGPVEQEDCHIWISFDGTRPQYYLVINGEPYKRKVKRKGQLTETSDLVWEDIADVKGIDATGGSQMAESFISGLFLRLIEELQCEPQQLEIMVQMPKDMTIPVPFLYVEKERQFEFNRQLVWDKDIFTDEGMQLLIEQSKN